MEPERRTLAFVFLVGFLLPGFLLLLTDMLGLGEVMYLLPRRWLS